MLPSGTEMMISLVDSRFGADIDAVDAVGGNRLQPAVIIEFREIEIVLGAGRADFQPSRTGGQWPAPTATTIAPLRSAHTSAPPILLSSAIGRAFRPGPGSLHARVTTVANVRVS